VSTSADASLEYLRGHLEEALATDGRVMEQGLSVRLDGETFVVTGIVSTPERCAAIDDVALDVAPAVVVRNHAQIVQLDEPGPAERI
jgi:BRCT domain type II-containing protein